MAINNNIIRLFIDTRNKYCSQKLYLIFIMFLQNYMC